ncbi:uncharacterized protein isoform X2 [Choristoneura fumiferana]
MSQSKSKIPSPSRSQDGPITPRRHRTRRTLSVASPARSDASGRLTAVVEQYLKDDKFTMSPMRRMSVLPDDTDIEMPRRASWWKRLEGSSRDVLEALDTNQMQGDLLEEYEFEVPQEKQTIQTLPENSDNDSVASIVVPHRRLFNQNKQPQEKFAEIAGSRKSLGRTLLDDQDQTIKELPKNLFSKGQTRNRPVFPAALLNSTNKTINKTVEPEPTKQSRNLFSQAGTKRKNMFTDFVLSDSEDDSLVQHKVFAFKKDKKRISLVSRNRRMPSLTPSVTTDIDIDDWNLLPSSTMIGNGSGAMEESRIIADEDIEQAQAENQDVTLTEANDSLEPEPSRLNTSNKSRKNKSLNRTRISKSRKLDDDFDRTLTNANIEAQPTENKQIENNAEFKKIYKSGHHNKTVVSETPNNNTMEIETSKQESGCKGETLQQDENNININEQTTENEPSIEDKMAELHKESEDKSEQEIEPSIEQESEKEISHDNQDKDIEKPESSGEISNNQEEDTNEPESSKEITNENQDNTKEEESSKEINNDNEDEEIDQDGTKEGERSKEISNDNQDEEMEPMVWSDNDAEKASVSNENDAPGEEKTCENDNKEENDENDSNIDKISNRATPVKEIPNKSQKTVESSAEEDEGEEQEQMEEENDVVDETPNTSYDTTGRNRKKRETEVNSPETVLKNTSKDDMSFKPIGRSTSFRKSKSAIEDINIRPTLIPIQESTIGSEGSRNSSTEGSGWDSHRTTRQTLRQTFGKDFTPRKSLRALVMEQSAKRKMGDINTSKASKTKNKTVEDVADHNIRDRRVSTRNLSSDQLPGPKSPVPDISTHHESDPLISKPQVSYHKSLHDINEPHISRQTLSNEKSVNSNQATIDSGPEISIDASYGQGMSREAYEHENEQTMDKTKHIEKSRHNITAIKDTVPIETDQDMQEELDYDPSIQDSMHDASVAELSEHKKSEALSEKEDSDQDEHSIKELSDHDKEESSHDEDETEEKEDSEQEVEAEEEDEESQQDIEPESEEELEHEESQQIEVESEQDEELEMSQQELQSEDEERQETEHEVELDSERESENDQSKRNESQESVNGISHQESDQESDRNISDVPEIELDSDNEQNDQSSEKLTERVVFDNEMSDQEIDYELSDRISRQITEDDVTEHVSDMETDGEMSASRFSEPAKELDESVGTKKSLLLMQMQRIAQQNMEIKMKIREQVKNSLKPTSNANKFMPLQSKFPVRRVSKPEPKKLKNQPRQTTLAFGALPKEFVEDLKYKPPKRYQPATAPWITKRLYKFLETKLEPKYDYRARVRAEELVQTIHSFAKLVRRRDLAPQNAVDELKKEMARLNVVKTHFEFYEFFHDFMPREVRVKVNPDVVNRIPMPRNGIFGDILQSRTDTV